MFGSLEKGLGINWENPLARESRSMFESRQNDDEKIKFSNMIQFYMGVINTDLYLEKKPLSNMRQVIESN